MKRNSNSLQSQVLQTWPMMLLLCLACTAAQAFDPDQFHAEVSQAGIRYETHIARPDVRKLDIEGRVSESNDSLKNLVPDGEKTLYDYFILGNMLYRQDPESSYTYMKRAEALSPANPLILYERGIHEHRLGNFDAATGYYERIVDDSTGRQNPVFWAYLAHAYLMTGRSTDAFRAWEQARFDRHHTAIEKGMYTLFATHRQARTRESLIRDIHSGQTTRLCDLWELDSNWEIDWWNYRAKDKYLEFDRKLAELSLEPGTVEQRLFQFCSADGTPGNEAYLAELESLGVLGDDARLPDSPALVYRVLQQMISRELTSAAEFLAQHESRLVELAERQPFEKKYLDVLGFLYANTGDTAKLREIDWQGWKKLQSEPYASSYVVALDPASEAYGKHLETALADFPNSATLNQIRLRNSPRDRDEAMMTFVAAQFANLHQADPNGYRLHDYMVSLKHELAKTQTVGMN